MTDVLNPAALRSARRASGLTQGELSVAVGVATADRVSLWELGRADPHPQQLRRLADALGVTIGSLLKVVPAAERDLRRLRLEAGLSVVDLALRVHVAPQTLKRWESGVVRTLGDRAPIDALAESLTVGPDEVRAAIEQTIQR